MKIQEAKNSAVQLSDGRYFFMVNKFLIKKGEDRGKALIVAKMSELSHDPKDPSVGVFTEVKSFLMTPKEFDAWIALLIQLGDKELTELKNGKKDKQQASL